MRKRIWLALPVAMLLPVGVMLAALAQDKQDNPPPATATAPIPQAPPAAAAAAPPASKPQGPAPQAGAPQAGTPQPSGPVHRYSREQLEQMVAPVALYPDRLLGDILMASTYPAEIVEAARWVRIRAHRRLKGEALAAALKPKGWDPSVMALVPFPDLLKAMNDRLEWLRDLGTAFVAQQADVMAAVQHLRRLAMAAGTLKTTPQCHCQVATHGETITITAVEPGPLCIPVYNTRVAYGAWPYPVYPPVVFPIPVGVVFVPGFAIGYYPVEVAWYGPIWGWDSIDWAAGQIVVDPGRYAVLASGDPGFSGNVWSHDPARWGSVAAAAGVGGAVAAAAMHGHGAAAAPSGAAGAHAAAAHAGPGGAFTAHAGRPAGGGAGRHSGHGFAGHGGRRYHAPHVAMHGRFSRGFSGGGGPHFGMHGFGHGGGHGGGGPHFGMGGFAHGGGGHGGGGHGGGGHGGGHGH
ncbi:MAG: DUF3300 domain-containing protein [Thiohalocapsa sp.]